MISQGFLGNLVCVSHPPRQNHVQAYSEVAQGATSRFRGLGILPNILTTHTFPSDPQNFVAFPIPVRDRKFSEFQILEIWRSVTML